MVKLYNENKDKGLQLVSLTVDEIDEQMQALAFLKEQNADLPNFILSVKEDEAPEDILNYVSLPLMVIYDREGKEVARFQSKAKSEEEFIKEKKDFLAKATGLLEKK